MMSRIWALPEATRSRYDLSSLEAVWHTAAPMPAWLKEAWIDWIGPEKVWEIYGGTERPGNTVLSGTEWLPIAGPPGGRSTALFAFLVNMASHWGLGRAEESIFCNPPARGRPHAIPSA